MKTNHKLKLIKGKCLPILLYGLETCPLKKADLRSLDFVIDCLFMKLFKTNKIDVVRECQQYFSPLGKVAGRAIYFTDVFSLFFIIFFSGRPRSHAGSEANGPIFTKISGLVDN